MRGAVQANTFPTYLAAARETLLPKEELLEDLERMARSKHEWIEKFASGRNKRPDNEISTALQHFAVLVQVRDLIDAPTNE